jgi:hypothetical protein
MRLPTSPVCRGYSGCLRQRRAFPCA